MLSRSGIVEWLVALVLAALLTFVGVSRITLGAQPSFSVDEQAGTYVLLCGVHTFPELDPTSLQSFASLG